MFGPDCCNESASWNGHKTSLPFSKSIYSSIRQKVMISLERNLVWNDGDEKGPQSLVGYLQMLSYKPSTRLNCTALVAYHAQIVLINFSVKLRRWLVENGHISFGFCAVRLCDDLKKVVLFKEDGRL